MAKRIGFSFVKNGAHGFVAAAAVVTATPAFADPPGLPSAQAGVPRVMGLRYVHFFSSGNRQSASGGNHESGFVIGKGITGGANVTDVVRGLSLERWASALLAITGRTPIKSSSYMQVDMTLQSLGVRGDERDNSSQHGIFSVPFLEPLPDKMTVMINYPKALRLN